MTTNSNLYDKIVLTPPIRNTDVPRCKTYKGFSTINQSTENCSLYDLE